MTEKTNKKRLRVQLTKTQKLLLVPVLLLVLGLLGYGWYYWKTLQADQSTPNAGINISLPDAQFRGDDPADKMAYYDKARQDSARTDTASLSMAAEKLGFSRAEDEQTKKINDKLSAINQALNTPYGNVPVYAPSVPPTSHAPMSKDVDRLEKLMAGMQQGDTEDKEMAQLGNMMDKLLALQNPELAKKLVKKDVGDGVPDSLFRAVPAVIASNQRAKQGSVVELRLGDSLVINGQVIPKGHMIYGLASFSNQRLNLEIKNIRLGTSIIPVNITVFDQRDGMAGINAPEALLSDAVNGGILDASGGIGITGFDLTTQIAGAGIDAAKNLLTKKVGRVKQSLKAGYPLLLRDNTKKNNLSISKTY